MELVGLTCTNCGAPLEEAGGMFRCAHCGSVYIKVCDPADGFDAGSMSIEEFEKKLSESSVLFAVKGEEGTELFDTDAEIAASRLKYAAEKLCEGDFAGAADAVKEMPEDSFAAERVRMLAAAGAKDEGELAAFSGDLNSLPHFKNVVALADDRARAAYLKLSDICAAGAEASRKIKKGMAFVDAHDAEKAKLYADEMLRAYPTRSEAWELYMAAKCLRDEKYDPASDLCFMKKCPDFKYVFGDEDFLLRPLSPVLASRLVATTAKKNTRAKFLNKYILTPVAVVVSVGVGIALWQLLSALFGE